MSQRTDSAPGFNPESGIHQHSQMPTSGSSPMEDLVQLVSSYNVQLEEMTRSMEAEIELCNRKPSFQSPIHTLDQHLDMVEQTLDNLRCKFIALKTTLRKRSKPKSGSEALRGQNDLEATSEAHTSEQPLTTLSVSSASSSGDRVDCQQTSWPLELHEYKRYGRQLIMPEIGLHGQLRLKKSKVLIIGAGGLGCPAAAYIAGAGVGHITVVDGDVVEESNLHRQIMHTTEWLGKSKANSLVNALRLINPITAYEARPQYFEPAHAELFKDYTIILDCTDRPASRYLISDAASALGIPLVSASALRTEGQIMILNDPPAPAGDPNGGPCYRCIFPKPPPAESVLSCGDGGIIGPVVGMMGVLQALETIKILTRPMEYLPQSPSMLMLSAYSTPMFRSMKLRRRNPTCKACSASATISLESLRQGEVDYVTFCGAAVNNCMLSPKERVAAKHYAQARSNEKHVLVDVREKAQFDLCSLLGSINIPYSTVQRWKSRDEIIDALNLRSQVLQRVYVICRLGNDSQVAVRKLKELGIEEINEGGIFDIEGGFRAWRRDVDNGWPDY